jgi:serine/threonine protein kinase
MGVERPAAGRVIGGKYRIERPLGAGAWAQVFLAEHVDLHSKVAIKILTNWESCSDKQLGRFLREARSAARLKTIHVCRVLDVGRTEEGAPFTVLEHLDGTDFQHVVEERGRLDPATAVEYVLQACEGLAEAHASGIVHRDLKPANMFLTAAPDGSPLVKILDFGISKEMTGQKIDIHLTRSTDLLGTPFYMSPEQLRDAAEVDARTDIWSMGVILWRMLSGVMPFEGGSFAELCVSIMTGPPPSRGLEHIPSGLVDTLYRCLEKDPARRFENVRQLAGALSHWLSGEESSRVSRISRVLARYGSAADATAGGPPRSATPAPVPAIGALDPTADAAPPSLAVTTPRPFAAPAPRWRRILFIGGIAAGLAMAGVAVILLLSRDDAPAAAAAAHADAAPVAAQPAPVAAPPPAAAEPPAETAVDAAPVPTVAETPPRALTHRAVHKKKPPLAPAKPPPASLYERRR